MTKKILIIEDEKNLARFVSLELQHEGYEVIVEVNGREGSRVWKYDEAVETNVVDVYIRYLRGKIDIPGKESYIQTVRGMGYVIREK